MCFGGYGHSVNISYTNTKLHMINDRLTSCTLNQHVLPAIVYSDGTTMYYLDGKLHNTKGPAAIYPDGTTMYYVNGELHNTNGPAAIYPDGTRMYYINGVCRNNNPLNTIYKYTTNKYNPLFPTLSPVRF